VTLKDAESDMDYESDIDQYFEEVDLEITSTDYDHIEKHLEKSAPPSPKEIKGQSNELRADQPERSKETRENNNNQSYKSSCEDWNHLDAVIRKVSEKTPPMKKVNLLDPLDSRCTKGSE
jgi:hypothetical protein